MVAKAMIVRKTGAVVQTACESPKKRGSNPSANAVLLATTKAITCTVLTSTTLESQVVGSAAIILVAMLAVGLGLLRGHLNSLLPDRRSSEQRGSQLVSKPAPKPRSNPRKGQLVNKPAPKPRSNPRKGQLVNKPAPKRRKTARKKKRTRDQLGEA